MYEIRPDSVKQFILDRNIQLPRFQRKQTWDEKKNFQLVISIFKDYPMGVCIISKEKNANRTISYLLDGRQRRNVFKMMYDNPENICTWAKKFLNYKNSTNINELKDIFDEKVNLYLEEDDDNYDKLDNTQNNIDDDTPLEEADTEEFEKNYGNGRELLFTIISTFYKVYKHYTGFSEPFDFDKYLSKVPYVDSDPVNIYKLNGTKLKNFIDEYRKDCDINYKAYDSEDVFCDYLLNRSSFKQIEGQNEEKIKNNLKSLLHSRWQSILLRIDLVDEIDKTLNTAKIGIIEVSAISSSDSQKIFNIINSEGVKLTAAEVLSASANWNKRLNNPSADMKSAAKDLYLNMDISNVNDVVKWDVPATILGRIGKNLIFKDLSWDSKEKKSEFEKKITLGFKICAGIFLKRITKDDIAKLGQNNIDWDMMSESLVIDIKNMLHIIANIPYFKLLSSWQTTIMDITSDSVALDFFFEMYFDWKRKGSPLGNSATTAKFQKNCIILLDQLIYEYINLQWRGSADSKIARNLDQFNNEPDLFVPVSRDDWAKTLKQIRDNLLVNDTNTISYVAMKPLLYHTYCLYGIGGPYDAQEFIEIDHIMPKSIFEQSALPKKDLIKDSLFNLGLLPKKENISKGDDRLNRIEDQWLKGMVEKYEFIKEDMFDKYSNLNNYSDMFDYRKEQFFDVAFGEKRDYLLNN